MKAFLILLALGLSESASSATFKEFQVTPAKITAIPKLHGSAYKQFKTRAKNLVAEYKAGEVKALGGHVLFTIFGCGTECTVLMGINLYDGEVRVFEDVSAFTIDYRTNSRLLIVNKGGLNLTFEYPEQHFFVDDEMNLSEHDVK